MTDHDVEPLLDDSHKSRDVEANDGGGGTSPEVETDHGRKVITVRLPKDLYKEVHHRAIDDERTVQSIVTEALGRYIGDVPA